MKRILISVAAVALLCAAPALRAEEAKKPEAKTDAPKADAKGKPDAKGADKDKGKDKSKADKPKDEKAEKKGGW